VLSNLRFIKFISLFVTIIFVITLCIPFSPNISYTEEQSKFQKILKIFKPKPEQTPDTFTEEEKEKKPDTPLTEEERERAKNQCILKYTAGGVITGALLGLLLERDIGGAIKGAAVGGTLAFAIAWGACLKYYSNIKSSSVADASETARKIKYDPSQGVIAKVENLNLTPNPVSPGDKVQMSALYYVMVPDKTQEIKVTETRTVYYYDENGTSGTKGWKELGSVDYSVTVEPGTRKAEGDFELPEQVPEGKYKIVLKISTEGASNEASQELIVKKGVAKAPAREPLTIARAEQNEVKTSEKIEQPGVKAIEKSTKKLIKVVSKSLTVRESPSLKSRPIGMIKQDEMYEVIDTKTVEKQKWFKIKLEDGTEGWVLSKYVKMFE